MNSFPIGPDPIDLPEVLNLESMPLTVGGSVDQGGSTIGTVDKKDEKKTVDASLATIPFPFITYTHQGDMIKDLERIAESAGMSTSQILNALYGGADKTYAQLISFLTDSWVKNAQASAEQSAQNMAKRREEESRVEMIRQGLQFEKHGAELAKGAGKASSIGGVMAMGAVLAVGFPASQLFSNSVMATMQVLSPTTLASVLGGLTSVIGATVVGRAASLSLAKAGQGEKVYNREYIDNLSKEAIAVVENKTLGAQMNGVLTDAGFSEAEAKDGVNVVRLTFLLDTLAIGYRAEGGVAKGQDRGGITSGEMRAMLSIPPTIKFPEGDSRNSLISMIQLYHSFLPKSTASALMDRYYAYLDNEKPSFDELHEPVRAIHSMFQTTLSGSITA